MRHLNLTKRGGVSVLEIVAITVIKAVAHITVKHMVTSNYKITHLHLIVVLRSIASTLVVLILTELWCRETNPCL